MPVISGAEAYAHAGGPTGVLLCHGFTGSPQSLRPWAECLAGAGLSVSSPEAAWPRHGVEGTGQDSLGRLVRRGSPAFDEMQSRCDEIFLMGLSMGACLALRLAERGDGAVRGLVLVNPSLTADNKLLFAVAPVLKC